MKSIIGGAGEAQIAGQCWEPILLSLCCKCALGETCIISAGGWKDGKLPNLEQGLAAPVLEMLVWSITVWLIVLSASSQILEAYRPV